MSRKPRWVRATADLHLSGCGRYAIAKAVDLVSWAAFYFDGVGITQQPTPANTALLNAIWAAPTGEVFAVGTGGAIIKGP